MSHISRSTSSLAGRRSLVVALSLIALLTAAMGLLSWRVSADETVSIGTEADRIYITDGFYDPEQSTENGTYRWTQPLGQLSLPNWGPGRIHVAISGVGASSGQALLKIEGVPVAQAEIAPGQSWRVEAWGVSGSRNPSITIEAPAFNPPGDNRTLSLLVKSLDIYAPDARIRALFNIALLGLAGALLFLFLQFRTSNTILATIAGLSIPALFAPLAIYRDPWMDTVAWVAAFTLLTILFLQWRLKPNSQSAIRNPQLAIILALTCALFLLYMGYMNAFDADRMYQVAAGIAEYGRPTRYPGMDTWTKYGFGQPLIAVPFYWLGKLGVLLGGAFDPITRLAVSLTNLAITSLTCWLLYRGGRRFASATVAMLVAATYLLTTPALNYARTFFSEPAGGLLLLAALLLIIPHAPGETLQPRRVFLAGLCLGAMILFKPAFAIYIPIPGLAVLGLAFSPRRTKDEGRRTTDDLASEVSHLPFVFRLSSFVPPLLFAIGPMLALIVQGIYNYVRYEPLADAVFRTGYEKEAGFSTPLLEGLGGILLSPGKSIFLYAPVLLLVPLGFWMMFRRGDSSGKLTTLLLVGEVGAGLLFNALWWAWTGNFAWGPRLIMPVLPLLLWPLASVGAFAFETASATIRRVLLGSWAALAALGALVSIPGALVDFQIYFRSYGLLLAGDPGEAITIYSIPDSPLLVEPGYLFNGLTAAIHRPSLASTGMPPVWDSLVPGALVVLSVICLWYGTRDARVFSRGSHEA